MNRAEYQVCDDVFRAYELDELAPHLAHALHSSAQGTRWWAAHWAMHFPHPSLLSTIEPLIDANDPDDDDARYFLVAAVDGIWRDFGAAAALDVLRRIKTTETSTDIVELLADVQ